VITFYKISSQAPVIQFIADKINSKLADDQKVLWLLSGGSSIDIEVKVADLLEKNKLSNLIVTLADERYGPVGHKDSNWQQLIEAGFSLPEAQLKPILHGPGMEETAAAYEKELLHDLENADYSLALAGIGADGHIFGIKAGSPAVETNNLIAAYEWGDYKRITSTYNLIKKINEIVSYVAGEEKHAVLNNLEHDLSVNEQPAQLLKTLDSVTIFNDFKGDKL
jgi:6-phosphogluconolactonase/glucosamine-6-phosphate isomerase/deaminase